MYKCKIIIFDANIQLENHHIRRKKDELVSVMIPKKVYGFRNTNIDYHNNN